MHSHYKHFLIRNWQPNDRTIASNLIAQILAEYGLASCGLADQPGGADWDVLHVEEAYWQTGGEFWVVEEQGPESQTQLVGTAGYYPIDRGENAVEIRKMYLLPEVRGQGLGRYLLQALEQAIIAKGFQQIWIETATVLKEAVQLYERNGYQLGTGVETTRCDRVYTKDLRSQLPAFSPSQLTADS